MNRCVPDRSMEDNYYRSLHSLLPPANQRKSTRPDHELLELLWPNGHVVLHSPMHRKTMTSFNEIKQCQRPETTLKCGPFETSTKIVDEEESAPWLQYPIDDSLDKAFCSNVNGLTTESQNIDKIKCLTTEENNMEYIFKESNDLCFEENVMPHPKSQFITSVRQTTSADAGDVINFPHFSRAPKVDLGPLLGNMVQGKVGETSSMMTSRSSLCGGNQVHDRFDVSCCNAERVSLHKVKEDAQTGLCSERAHTDTHEATITSSSGGLGCSFGRADQHSAGAMGHKRKRRDADEFECQSEEAEYESMEANRQAQRFASARRSRAAEVHNLAERRRRDRINEKMRALQELIPHCNKSDKASMLDEAIEYLKSLQLQLQMMWTGSGMAAMMLPGVQHYMPRMGAGVGHGLMPSVHGPTQFPRVPLVSQSMPSNSAVGQASVLAPFANPVNFHNQMQSALMPESYAHYLGLHHMQPSPQAMNLYGLHLMQQNQRAVASSSGAPSDLTVRSENIQNIKTG